MFAFYILHQFVNYQKNDQQDFMTAYTVSAVVYMSTMGCLVHFISFWFIFPAKCFKTSLWLSVWDSVELHSEEV